MLKKDLQRTGVGIKIVLKRVFDKDYIKKKIKKRRGKCKKCGKCCRGCFFLDKKIKLCRIYNSRPGLFCYREFPLDKRDQELWQVEKTCGYSFKNK